jgi:hypothetical protein
MGKGSMYTTEDARALELKDRDKPVLFCYLGRDTFALTCQYYNGSGRTLSLEEVVERCASFGYRSPYGANTAIANISAGEEGEGINLCDGCSCW